MKTALVEALRESRGYLEDKGWHQTAQLMTLAAHEIERLNRRVRALENSAPPRDTSPANTESQVISITAASRRSR